jgi:hypothetical protein
MFTQTQIAHGIGPPPYDGWSSGSIVVVTAHPYQDLGLRLFGFGIFLVAATFYQTLAGERRKKGLLKETHLM